MVSPSAIIPEEVLDLIFVWVAKKGRGDIVSVAMFDSLSLAPLSCCCFSSIFFFDSLSSCLAFLI